MRGLLFIIACSLALPRHALAQKVTLACVDCYSSSGMFAAVAKELVPNTEVEWILVKTHTYDPVFASYRSAFPEDVTEFEMDPDSPASVAATVAALKARGVHRAVGGMDVGTYHAVLLNKRLGAPDNDVRTRDLRRKKLEMAKAVGAHGIPTYAPETITDAMQFVDSLKHPEVVLKFDAGAAGVGFEHLPRADRVALKQRIAERLVDKTPGLFGNKDRLILQPRIVGREFYVNTFSVNGRTTITALWEYTKVSIGETTLYFVDRPLDLDGPLASGLLPVVAGINLQLGVHNGPAHIEMMKEDKTGWWYLIENNPRVAGGGLPATDRAIWGRSQLDLHVLSILAPERLEADLKTFPRRKLQDGALVMIPSAYTRGRMTEAGAKFINALPSFAPPMECHRPQSGRETDRTIDLKTIQALLHFVGTPEQVRADFDAVFNATMLGQIVEPVSPLLDCRQELAEVQAYLHTLSEARKNMKW